MKALSHIISWLKGDPKAVTVPQPHGLYDGPAFRVDGVTSIYFHEDDYCQIELLPEENGDHLVIEGQKVRETAEKNFDGYGFTAIHVPAREPLPLASRKIPVSFIEEVFSMAAFKRIPKVYSGSMSDRAEAPDTVAFKLDPYVVYFDHKDGIVLHIWLQLFWKAEPENRVKLLDALHEIGKKWQLVLMHWPWSRLIDLRDRTATDDYLTVYPE